MPTFFCHFTSSQGGGQGFVDIRERLLHLLVFYYKMVKIVTCLAKYISDSLLVCISCPIEIYINLTKPKMVSQDTEFATHNSPDPTHRKEKKCFALFVSLWFGQVLVLRLKAEAKSKEKQSV